MSNYAKNLSAASNRKATSQLNVIPGRETEMAQNNAGGFSFVLNEWDYLDRFLILGTECGTYYASEQKLTAQNLKNVTNLLNKDGARVVARVVEISDSGRAAKNDPALFVLALAASSDDLETRRAAFNALPKVARTGTHLFHFAMFVNGMRGWGRALRNAIGNWYLDKNADDLAMQIVKYQQRDGWSHRDLLRLAHPKAETEEVNNILRWVVKKGDHGLELDQMHRTIAAFERAKAATSVKEIVNLITEYNLPREAIPTHFLNEKEVWDALLVKMPMTAMIRNLATMTRVGLIAPLSDASKTVRDRLLDENLLRKARIHPLNVLTAFYTYNAGRGVRGSNTWTPVSMVVEALDKAFYLSFGNVESTGKNTLLALDVSGSMTFQSLMGIPNFTAREASAALALVTANVEPNVEFVGFTDTLRPLNICKGMSLDTVIKNISGLPFGSTDCSQPFVWASKNKIPVENFAVYTDNETYYGQIHPSQALANYRNSTGIAAKSVVVGMTATNFTIADPKDGGMLDVVGFDSNAPQIIADFFAK